MSRRGTDNLGSNDRCTGMREEMISESPGHGGVTWAKTLANVIHTYPTQAEAIKQVADAYNRTRLTPFVQRLFAGGWLGGGRSNDGS